MSVNYYGWISYI